MYICRLQTSFLELLGRISRYSFKDIAPAILPSLSYIMHFCSLLDHSHHISAVISYNLKRKQKPFISHSSQSQETTHYLPAQSRPTPGRALSDNKPTTSEKNRLCNIHKLRRFNVTQYVAFSLLNNQAKKQDVTVGIV